MVRETKDAKLIEILRLAALEDLTSPESTPRQRLIAARRTVDFARRTDGYLARPLEALITFETSLFMASRDEVKPMIKVQFLMLVVRAHGLGVRRTITLATEFLKEERARQARRLTELEQLAREKGL